MRTILISLLILFAMPVMADGNSDSSSMSAGASAASGDSR